MGMNFYPSYLYRGTRMNTLLYLILLWSSIALIGLATAISIFGVFL